MNGRIHCERSWSARRTSDPSAPARAGHQFDQQPRQPDGLVAQVVANERLAGGRHVAFVEDEVDNGQHRPHPIRQLCIAWYAIRDVGGADLVFRTHQPLRHRRFGDQQGAGNLWRLQTCDQSQRQRNLRFSRERRMATREDQPQSVVFHGTDLLPLVGRVHKQRVLLAIVARRLATQPVDATIAGGRDDPTRGAGR